MLKVALCAFLGTMLYLGVMAVREHDDNSHRGFYAWMVGDFASRQHAFLHFLVAHTRAPASSGVALDVGAGHGLQAVPLARQSFAVTVIDFELALRPHFQS